MYLLTMICVTPLNGVETKEPYVLANRFKSSFQEIWCDMKVNPFKNMTVNTFQNNLIPSEIISFPLVAFLRW